MDSKILKGLTDYQSLLHANDTNQITLFDYLQLNLKEGSIQPDLSIAFLSFFWPEFISVDGLVYLKEEYSEKRLSELKKQNRLGKNLDYWMNLISIDGMFDSATREQCEYISARVVDIWTAKLMQEFPDISFSVEAINDDEDIFLVFYQN